VFGRASRRGGALLNCFPLRRWRWQATKVASASTNTTTSRWWKADSGLANLAEIIDHNAQHLPDTVVFSRREKTGWEPVTALQVREQVRGVAQGLLAAGVQPGDRVVLMSKTRYEWQLVDFAIWSVGAVTVPVYETSAAEQLRWILDDSAAVAAVVETAGHARLLASLGDLSDLRASWVIEGPGSTLDDLIAGALAAAALLLMEALR